MVFISIKLSSYIVKFILDALTISLFIKKVIAVLPFVFSSSLADATPFLPLSKIFAILFPLSKKFVSLQYQRPPVNTKPKVATIAYLNIFLLFDKILLMNKYFLFEYFSLSMLSITLLTISILISSSSSSKASNILKALYVSLQTSHCFKCSSNSLSSS